ncbi:MAG: hypothetical protein K940chlam3_01091 [Chlamydiae bacterium]|nr:hypothetical protein [Chlamydiota bacterium]
MTDSLIIILLTSTFIIALMHTVIAPDHYFPIIAVSRANHWSVKKTVIMTILCGLAHVLPSVLLAILSILIGLTLSNMQAFDSLRGNIAGWFLITYGLFYLIWGVYKLYRHQTHFHHHHMTSDPKEMTPYMLILLFIISPCEPLIPLILYPGLEGSPLAVVLVTIIFTLVTIITMLFIVLALVFGANMIKTSFFEKYRHVISGTIIFSNGVAIKLLSL